MVLLEDLLEFGARRILVGSLCFSGFQAEAIVSNPQCLGLKTRYALSLFASSPL